MTDTPYHCQSRERVRQGRCQHCNIEGSLQDEDLLGYPVTTVLCPRCRLLCIGKRISREEMLSYQWQQASVKNRVFLMLSRPLDLVLDRVYKKG